MKPSGELLPSADGTPTLVCPRTGATYHSQDGALQESLHVYVRGSGLPELLNTKGHVRVLEVGFGTGLNFALTVQYMQTNPSKTLAYTALEKYPLAEPVVAQYHTQVGTSPHIVQVISTLPASGTVGNVVYDLRTTPLEPNLELGSCFDIVYFDPFGPHAAPEMWEPPMLDAVFRHIAPGGFLATFSVTGHFKRYLRQRGIPFQRMPGFGRKRERMLAGPMPNIFLALHSH